MKKKMLTILILFLLTQVVLSAQAIPQQNQQISHRDLARQYLNKSKSQKTISNILLVSGGALLLTGMIISVASLQNGFDFSHPDNGSSGTESGGILAISGACILIAGIPFDLAARHNKKKAALLLRDEKLKPGSSFISGRVYSIGISIQF
jgi:hypothetical protein